MPDKISTCICRMKLARVIAGRLRRLELNLYLDTPKALLEVLKHFMSAIRSFIDSPSKLCRVDERAQKGHFWLSALSHLTVSLVCLPHLKHVISSGKLSKNIVLFYNPPASGKRRNSIFRLPTPPLLAPRNEARPCRSCRL
jgi:hypothetical protein